MEFRKEGGGGDIVIHGTSGFGGWVVGKLSPNCPLQISLFLLWGDRSPFHPLPPKSG